MNGLHIGMMEIEAYKNTKREVGKMFKRKVVKFEIPDDASELTDEQSILDI